MTEVLKGLGFQDILSMDSVKSALSFFEVDCVDWVITPLLPKEKVNAMHLLDTFTQYPKFEKVRVSFILDDAEQIFLPKAFELGLLSSHPKPYNRESLQLEMNKLLETFAGTHWNAVLTAACYLEAHLKANGRFKSLLALQEKLLEQFPDNSRVMLSLAEAQFLAGATQDAKTTLGQARVLGYTGWDLVARTYLPEGEVCRPSLGIQTCLLVDPDESVHKSIRNIFTQFQDFTLVSFTDGETAAAWCQSNPPPDLILQEWRIPRLSGPSFLQRIRALGIVFTPIVILSSLTTKKDLPLLNEMGVANVVQKPLEEKRFLKTLLHTLQTDRFPHSPVTLERKISQLLLSGDLEGATRMQERLERDSAAPVPLKKYVQALFAFHAENFEASRTLAVEAIRGGPSDQVKAIALLGRCLAKLRDFDGAVKCFKRSNEMSPKNILRLCELADAQSEKGETLEAVQTLGEAKAIDEANPIIKIQESKHCIRTGDIGRARQLLGQLKALTGVIADMNNSAVALIRSGKFNDGIMLYERTLDALPECSEELRSRVLYNLGLAHARQGTLEAALKALEKAPLVASGHPVHCKISSLHMRIRRALDNREPLDLRIDRSSSEPLVDLETLWLHNGTAASGNTLALPTSTAGTRCCHLIFHSIEQIDTRCAELLSNRPNFKMRAAIERDESFGIERLVQMKS